MCVSNADKGHVCSWSWTVEIVKLFASSELVKSISLKIFRC